MSITRVTNRMMSNTLLRNLSAGASRMNKLQDQMSSSYRITRLSDDPLGMVTSLNSRSKIYAMDRHVQNLDDADAWLTMVETGLMDVNKIVTTVYTDTIDAATDVKTSAERKAIAEKVREFRDQLMVTANTTITDKYTFGGYNATTAPFEIKDGVLYYNGYNMYASEFEALNPEKFILDATQMLTDVVAGATDQNDARDKAATAYQVMDELIAVARNVYNSRTIEVEQPPAGSGIYVTVQPTAQHMFDALEEYWSFRNAAAAPTPEEQAVYNAIHGDMANAMTTSLDETHLLIGKDDMMKHLEAALSSAKATSEGLAKLVNDGTIADLTGATDYMTERLNAANTQNGKTLFGVSSGLTAELANKYEIEVGYGQLMNITLNGVELFDTGDQNLYKIIDDLYKALTRDFVDTNYGQEAYAKLATDIVSGKLEGITVEADYRQMAADITNALTTLAEAGRSIAGSDMKNVIDGMRAAIDESWTAEQTDAADQLILKVQAGIDAGQDRDDIMDNLAAVLKTMAQLDSAIDDAADLTALQNAVDTAKNQTAADLMQSRNGLKTGSIADDITPFISRLQNKQKDMMGLLAIVGGRTNRIDIMQERYSLDHLNYTERISKIEDVDMTEAIMHFKMAESVYNSALAAGARVIQPTLMDFMR